MSRLDAIRQLADGCASRLVELGLPEPQYYPARDAVIARIENYHDRLTSGEWSPMEATGGYNRKALLRRGWTPALIRAVLGDPDRTEQHRRGYMRWSEHFYAVGRVMDAERSDPRFTARQELRRRLASAAARRREEVPQRYTSWRQALPDCAAALFSLNRYAKYQSCSVAHRSEIYQLKDELIQMLWERGYCTLSWIHRLQLPALPCRECAVGDWNCMRCGGSGVYRAAKTLEFWCFEFAIGDRKYCWHQPRERVEFEPIESVPPQAWLGPGGEKPLSLARNRFAMAKETIRWVLGESAAETRLARAEMPDAADELQTSAFRVADREESG